MGKETQLVIFKYNSKGNVISELNVTAIETAKLFRLSKHDEEAGSLFPNYLSRFNKDDLMSSHNVSYKFGSMQIKTVCRQVDRDICFEMVRTKAKHYLDKRIRSLTSQISALKSSQDTFD